MNTLLHELALACRQHKTKEKLLLVQSLSAGHQLLESLSAAGQPWLNLRPVTAFDLAEQAAAFELSRRGQSVLSDGQSLFLLEEAIRETEAKGELTYFASLRETGNLSRVLYGPLMELRLAGLTALSLAPNYFVSEDKGREIKKILSRYELKLCRDGLADQAEVYRLALQAACRGSASGRNALFLIPEELGFAALPYSFILNLTGGRRIILAGEPVSGLPRPAAFFFPAQSSPLPQSPLSWLYSPLESPGPCNNVEVYRAYGTTCEVREVFRRLKARSVPLDQALLCHTAAGTYIPAIYTLAARLGIPVTFAEGLPLTFTRPGRLALGLVRWLEEKCSSALLYNILTSGDISAPSAGAMARMLRKAQVGWGRDRYIPRLEALASQLSLEAEEKRKEGDEPLAELLQGQYELIKTLRQLTSSVIDALPAASDGLLDFPALALGMARVVADRARKTGEIDGQALEAVKDALGEAARSYTGSLPENDAYLRLRLALMSVRVGVSGPKPGFLHVASYHQAGGDLRPHTFIVGLNAETFPGSGLQDPVLLDCERRLLSRRLPLREDAPAQNLHAMARFLASRRGSLTLSFPCHDTAEGRPASPAALLLQAHRLVSGVPDADFTSMLESLDDPVSFMPLEPEQSLSGDEWWLAHALNDTHSADVSGVTSCYPGLAGGLAAEAARREFRLTAYDGLVAAGPLPDQPVFSATTLEKLAHCPFAYFISHVLRVQPPEELEYDSGAWLDPLSRGSLLHDIYCRYLREAFPPGGTPKPDRERLLAIASGQINLLKEEIPPPSDVVFEYEREQLLRGLDVFWHMEEGHPYTPAYFEVPFGAPQEAVAEAGIGLSASVPLALPGGRSIALRGRIDRIDRTGEHSYAVFDFKTGGTYGYTERGRLRQGRQIQHALYSYAAEAILRSAVDPEAVVVASGYLFPTEKGEGQSFIRPGTERGNALAAVARLLDLVAAGIFCASHEKDRCTYCDYRAVCRAPRMAEKFELLADLPELAPWREVQDYE